MRYGRLPAKRDPRTLCLSSMLSMDLPPIPDKLPDFMVPTPMFGNDTHGCCVISAQAHATLRFELVEQGTVPPITEEDVLMEYFRQSDGADSGLYMLDAQKAWRKGWQAAGRGYNTAAFAMVDPCASANVRAGVCLFGSLQAGLSLPYSVTEDGIDPWVVVSGAKGTSDPQGGHAVALVGYDQDWITCVTWGRRVQMSWAFLECYTAELYAVVDDADKWLNRPGIDVEALKSYLEQLT